MALVPDDTLEDWKELSQEKVAISPALWVLLENEWNPAIKGFRMTLSGSSLSIEDSQRLLALLQALKGVLHRIIPSYDSKTDKWSGGMDLPPTVTRLIRHHIGNDLMPISMDIEETCALGEAISSNQVDMIHRKLDEMDAFRKKLRLAID
jgi:hypothetical protein